MHVRIDARGRWSSALLALTVASSLVLAGEAREAAAPRTAQSGEGQGHSQDQGQSQGQSQAQGQGVEARAGQGPQGAQGPQRRDQGLPLPPGRTASFTVHEGTWISLDVSPDGRTIAFELLGDLYTLPIAGGKATRLTDGPAFDAQPRYAPDGRSIAFVSDRDGGEHVWLIAPDGTGARQLTRGTNTRFQSPDWTPDGQIIVSKGRFDGFGTVYDQRGYDLVLYYTAGGNGVKLLPKSAGSPAGPGAGGGGAGGDTLMGATAGKDPRYIYAALKRSTPGGGVFPPWQIVKFDRRTGQTFTLTSGSAFRPIVSPDDRYLVYSTRDDAVTRMRVRDLVSGDETWLTGPVTRDEQESLFSRDLAPGSAFTPDGRALITSYGGKIWRIDVPSGRATEIPFTADVQLTFAPESRFTYTMEDDRLVAKQIRYPVLSPDGRRVAFTALSRIWVMDLPDGTPKRLTNQDVGEHWPAWSPDGRDIAFVTWQDTAGGDIYRARADGSGQPERLSRASAYYERLAYTRDGTRLVFVRGRKQARIESEPDTLQLAWMPAAGGEMTTVAPATPGAVRPHFGPDRERIVMFTPADGLVSVRFDGTDQRTVVKLNGGPGGGGPGGGVTAAVLSPSGDRAIVILRNQLYLVTVPFAGEAPAISLANPANAEVPVRKVTKVGADFPSWNDDGRGFSYSLGRFLFNYDLAAGDAAERRAEAERPAAPAPSGGGQPSSSDQPGTAGAPPASNAPNGPSAAPAYEPVRTEVTVTAPKDKPQGSIVLRNARILTMRGTGRTPAAGDVIERGDLVVTNNRIVAVGPSGRVTVPAGAKVFDVAGKTILPGWVDVHAHMASPGGVLRTQQWEYAANLAYGVTTSRNPQTGTTDVLAYQDLVDIGEMIGPRILSTGPGVFAAENITSLDDARNVIRRYAEYYGTPYIKEYGVGPRKVRQWLIMAAREQRVTPVTEPYYDIKKDVSEMQDGYPEMGHGFPIFPIYEDVLHALQESHTALTPTLITTFGGPKGYEYFYTRRPIHADPKLRRFWPHEQLDQVSMRRPSWYNEDLFIFKDHAKALATMAEWGVPVMLGSHGNMQGLGVHWELEMMASGMPIMDVLRGATIEGARELGFGKDLGSIEAGKLADLQVLDEDPRADIRKVGSIRYVMKNGRLYEAETLKEVWPRVRELPRQWWQEPPVTAPVTTAADGARGGATGRAAAR